MPDGAEHTPRLAMNKTEAAHALGVSVDFFDEHVARELRCVRRGRRRLYPLRELERWLESSAEQARFHGFTALTLMLAKTHVAMVVLIGVIA